MRKIFFLVIIGFLLFSITSTLVLAGLKQENLSSPSVSGSKSAGSYISKIDKKETKSLIGTWIKERIQKEDHDFPSEKNWQISVIFKDNGRFIWDFKRKDSENKTINESLTGTYTIEKGFLISFHFDKPSNQALKWLPEFFALWPNKLLGQQTFRFGKNYLRLGNDGHKTWIYLRRKDTNSQR